MGDSLPVYFNNGETHEKFKTSVQMDDSSIYRSCYKFSCNN